MVDFKSCLSDILLRGRNFILTFSSALCAITLDIHQSHDLVNGVYLLKHSFISDQGDCQYLQLAAENVLRL